MKIEEFNAGQWIQQYQYKSFSPSKINHEWNWDDARINVLLEQATRALGELNAFSSMVPDVDVFIQMHISKEAQTSSKIEGTNTSMEEALMPEVAVSPEKRVDWQEVRNYVEAMKFAINELERLPISNRLILETHKILMQGVRGRHKNPGEVRSAQNWIGGNGPMDAVFVPPHPLEVQVLMGDLENFMHNDMINVPDLVRAAISHYHFETIHPFNDGNGRIGRLLITLFLVSKGILQKPSLYLSDYFEKNRANYIDGLMRVRTSNDLTYWVRFFLNAVLETAQKGKQTFQEVMNLKQEMDVFCMSFGRRAEMANKLVRLLYSQPYVTAFDVELNIEISKPTANKLIKEFVNMGVLVEVTGLMRDRLYLFKKYMNLFAK